MDSVCPIPLDAELLAWLSCSPDVPQRPWSAEYGFLDDESHDHLESDLHLGDLDVDQDMILDGFDSEPTVHSRAGLINWQSAQPPPGALKRKPHRHITDQPPTPPDPCAMQVKFSVTRKSYVAPQATAAWESHKSELRRLYIDEDKTLNEIMSTMRAKGFEARSVKTRDNKTSGLTAMHVSDRYQ